MSNSHSWVSHKKRSEETLQEVEDGEFVHLLPKLILFTNWALFTDFVTAILSTVKETLTKVPICFSCNLIV